ncbi:SMC-Scp complex subunit ScpB (plasmid) [Peteryoungia desertarenae]|uniref:SMC-Scp complex subunit ScpB n=1 Tax=Peteryoungia desertarenae TaxID=1813451 RepID=A0ABX6QSL2_9HYPH|nr:SMC-Scp complex subunit ScpB [Peteryoungia desertarenae]
MTSAKAEQKRHGRGKTAAAEPYDRELEAFLPEKRWREWMMRVEAVLFASSEPVPREVLTRVVGRDCSVDLLIDDINAELDLRPYEIIRVAGGWQHRTKSRFGDTIKTSQVSTRGQGSALSELESLVLMTIAYFQPVTRAGLSKIIGKEVSRDTIAALRGTGFLAAGPRSPTPGAPYTYVTTRHFLSAFGLETLRDLPDIEALEDAGLLSREVIDNGPVVVSQHDDNDID